MCRMEEICCCPNEVMWRTFYGGLCSLGDSDLAVHLCDKLAEMEKAINMLSEMKYYGICLVLGVCY
ncbi:unnamed protein product [Rhodiola kirilowii]